MRTPTIAVVIVNWNSRADVLAGLRSLHDQTDNDIEIVVVDNGSTDGSAAAIRAAFPAVRVIEAGENLGFAEGCNRGIDATHSDWVFLFNNDATAEPTAVAELRGTAASAPADVGMLQPLILFTAAPTHVNSSGVTVYRTGQAGDRNFAHPVEVATSAGDPFCPTAGAALYRRSMLEAVRSPSGYLDREYFMYFEDVDLGWRCRLAGYRAVYVPSSRIHHRFQGSSRRRGKSFPVTQTRVNRVATLLRNGSLPLILRTLPVTVFELAGTLVRAGPRPVIGLVNRLPSILRDRRRIAASSRLDRRELERTWFTESPMPPPPLTLPNRDD